MTEPDPTPNPTKASNPSDAYPPTRPGALIIIIAVGLFVAVLGLENWPDISAHFSQIEQTLGL